MREESPIVTAVSGLAETLQALNFADSLEELTHERDRLVAMLTSYVKPRLVDPGLTMRVVVAGPTGSGKSTLVNTLVGADVCPTGAVRPTTRQPTIVTAHTNRPVDSVIGGVDCETVVADSGLLDSIYLVDTPDIDSTMVDHRAVAESIVDGSDVLVFVTSALRYADDVPWQVLRRAAARGIPVINVLNRVASHTSGSGVDFRRRLREAGLEDDLIVISEHHIEPGRHQIPQVAAETLRERIVELQHAASLDEGASLQRVLDHAVLRVHELADSIEDHTADIEALDAELSIEAAAKARDLDLGTPRWSLRAPPSSDGRWKLRRWRRVNRISFEKLESIRGAVTEDFTMTVEGDLRTWLPTRLSETAAVSEMRAIAEAALEGWFVYVQRMSSPFPRRDRRLIQAVIVESGLKARSTRAAEVLLGDQARELVDRATRELRGRVGVVYAQAVTAAVGDLTRHDGVSGANRLRGAAGRLMATVGA